MGKNLWAGGGIRTQCYEYILFSKYQEMADYFSLDSGMRPHIQKRCE